MSNHMDEPSPWQGTTIRRSWNAMSIGWLPTLIAVCSRNDGSIRLNRIAVQAGDSDQAVVWRITRDLCGLRHVLEAHLLADLARFGIKSGTAPASASSTATTVRPSAEIAMRRAGGRS